MRLFPQQGGQTSCGAMRRVKPFGAVQGFGGVCRVQGLGLQGYRVTGGYEAIGLRLGLGFRVLGLGPSGLFQSSGQMQNQTIRTKGEGVFASPTGDTELRLTGCKFEGRVMGLISQKGFRG